ncbi:conserved hypothetical protein [Histoplasma capsulatum var. duboisii H88]|uniref:Uncharacterized protein n=2 Tax=Ajellomyces capsulatus (strain H88) TaxID=544711 RepID=F0U843_AJEC8|nr:conserved hypothetical protein [Histoplasma capsulatum var. duboisii H88]
MTERNSFDRAEKVGLLMASLFSLYLTYYSRDSFPFEWLQKTEDLEVCCRETSSEKVAFPMSPELLKAINKCERVTAPGKCQQGLPGVGIMIDSYIRIKGVQIFQLRHNHWSCIVRDHSSAFDATQQGNSRDYLLRSELLAVTSIFFHQMNEMVWLPEEDWYMAKPIYKEEFLTATVVTFIYGKVRIVQATCNPSETYPTLSLTLRAICSLGKDNYDKKEAFNVLKWIFCPPEPAKELAMRGKSRSSYGQA